MPVCMKLGEKGMKDEKWGIGGEKGGNKMPC